MAKCSKHDCILFKCEKLGRCGRQEVKKKRKLTGNDPLHHKIGTTSGHHSARIQKMIDHQSDYSSDLEFITAFSRDSHWTEVVEPERAAHKEDLSEDMLAKLKETCKIWSLSLVNGITLGRRIGEGGQADIYEALFQNRSCLLIAKVFKEKNALSSLQHQCPPHIFQFEGDCKYIVRVLAGAVVDDGRFAFLMFRYQDDLRKVIDKNMMRNKNAGTPFAAIEAFRYMLEIACGMKILHSKNTFHRDLKASNILVWSRGDGDGDAQQLYCAVADYECSLRVKGTTFWRAPEVLQALKDHRDPQFTTKVDVYSYAMTCFEILTGSVPFEDLRKSNYDFVISGNRPEIPSDVSDQTRQLLSRCWHAIPDERPEFAEIVERVGWIMITELNVPRETVETLTKPRPDYQYT